MFFEVSIQLYSACLRLKVTHKKTKSLLLFYVSLIGLC